MRKRRTCRTLCTVIRISNAQYNLLLLFVHLSKDYIRHTFYLSFIESFCDVDRKTSLSSAPTRTTATMTTTSRRRIEETRPTRRGGRQPSPAIATSKFGLVSNCCCCRVVLMMMRRRRIAVVAFLLLPSDLHGCTGSLRCTAAVGASRIKVDEDACAAQPFV